MLPGRIAEIIEDNTVQYFLSLGYDAKDELCDTRNIKYVLNDKWNSRILHTVLDEDDVDPFIENIRKTLDERNLFALWLVTPFSSPGSIEACLTRYGFSLDRYWSSMALSIGDLPAPELPGGLKIIEAASDDELEVWANTMVKNFDMDEDVRGPFSAYYADIGIRGHKNKRFYLGLMDDQPVATASLFYGRDAAGIYYISTAKDHEGNGIGTAMTCHVLRDAARAGYKVATLNASEQGYPLYKRLGFKEYYKTKIYHSE